MKKILENNNLSLPLTSGVEIFLGCTIFEFGFFCLQELTNNWYKKQKMAPKWYFSKIWLKIKPRVIHILVLGSFWHQKRYMVYYRANSRKIIWFGIFWLVCPKYHLWGIFSTQCLFKNTKFISELKNIEKYRYLKFTVLLHAW